MKKVLIIEDDEIIQGLEARKIKNRGFEISSAQTGKEALNKILEPNIDIIILDLTLPDISGLDILKKIRETDSTKNIPVIVFSICDR